MPSTRWSGIQFEDELEEAESMETMVKSGVYGQWSPAHEWVLKNPMCEDYTP